MNDTEKKVIGEMAVILTDGGCKECNCDDNGRFNCLAFYEAECLYNAGYRKQSEVAREIFEEIEDALESCYDPDIHADYPSPSYGLWLADRMAELKKKYTEEK
jgi:hypothetical protein